MTHAYRIRGLSKGVFLSVQGTKTINISTWPAFHEYGKNKKSALSILKNPLVLHPKSLVWANFLSPAVTIFISLRAAI